jgi:hypothetical protein
MKMKEYIEQLYSPDIIKDSQQRFTKIVEIIHS